MAHVKYYSPSPAIIFSMALGVMMIFPSNFNLLVTANIFIGWAFRGLSYVGLLYLRKERKDLQRPFKVSSNFYTCFLCLVARTIFEGARFCSDFVWIMFFLRGNWVKKYLGLI